MSDKFGWREQILDVDLTRGEIHARPLTRDYCIATIGGIGLAARLLFDEMRPDADPMGPDNVLAIASGPLGGTTWAGTGRVEFAARSPLTGLWGEASMGGYLGTQIKRAGYDAILVRGISPVPVILVIDNETARLMPAGELWGQETYTTERILHDQYPDAEVATIGPAGERRVPMASLVHQEGNDVAARCGMGAVAGSKRLKGIVARGTHPVPLADEKTFQELKRESFKRFAANPFLQGIMRGQGTASMAGVSIAMNDLPVRNWDWEAVDWNGEAEKITGEAMHAQWPPKKDTCYACPIACKWTISAARLEGAAGHLSGPEYESLAGLGAQNVVNDPLGVIQVADLCTRLGVDTISAGATIAWAIEAFERGILDPQRTDGLELRYGDLGLVIELIRRISENRPGIGALLAQGSRRAAEQLGGGRDFAIQVKGLELPFHHPRAMRGLEIAYATLPRGASHNEEGAVSEEGHTYATWVADIVKHMDLSGANSSMVYCQFLAGSLDAEYTAKLLTATTGIRYTPEDLERAGERTWYLRRAFNLRLGCGLEADNLPPRVADQIKTATNVALGDFSQSLAEFHRKRELDSRGVPSASKLASLGLAELIPILDAP